MTDVGIFRAVFVGEGVLLVIDLGDEAVIIDPFRHGRRGRPGGAGLGNGFLTAGGQLGAESKAKERAQRPVKDAMVLHKKYLQHSLGGNPLPLGSGRSLVRRDALSLVFDILLDNCRGYFPDTTGKVSHRTRISFSSNSVWPGKDRIFAKDDVSFLVLVS